MTSNLWEIGNQDRSWGSRGRKRESINKQKTPTHWTPSQTSYLWKGGEICPIEVLPIPQIDSKARTAGTPTEEHHILDELTERNHRRMEEHTQHKREAIDRRTYTRGNRAIRAVRAGISNKHN